MKPATVISKRRGDEPEVHYLIGPQRATREEAEADLTQFDRKAAALTGEEKHACEVAAIAAPGEIRGLLDIIERLTGEKFEDRT